MALFLGTATDGPPPHSGPQWATSTYRHIATCPSPSTRRLSRRVRPRSPPRHTLTCEGPRRPPGPAAAATTCPCRVRTKGAQHSAVSMATKGSPNPHPSRSAWATPQSAAGAIPLKTARGAESPQSDSGEPQTPPPHGGHACLYSPRSRDAAVRVSEGHSPPRVSRDPPRENGTARRPRWGSDRPLAAQGPKNTAARRRPGRRPHAPLCRRPAAPSSSPPAIRLPENRRDSALPAGLSRAPPFALCIRFSWSGTKAAAAQSRSVPFPQHSKHVSAKARLPVSLLFQLVLARRTSDKFCRRRFHGDSVSCHI